MAENQKIIVPDMGGTEGAEVIEITVSVGDKINVDDTLLVVESDKATVDIPSPYAGEITSIELNVGDKVNEGSTIANISVASDAASSDSENTSTQSDEKQASVTESKTDNQEVAEESAVKISEADVEAEASKATVSTQDIVIPELGGSDEVEVIDVLINVGDEITIDQSLVTLESDKASMDVPALVAGVVESVTVTVGDKVKEGVVIATIKTQSANGASAEPTHSKDPAKSETPPVAAEKAEQTSPAAPKNAPTTPMAMQKPSPADRSGQTKAHASPAVRRFARELGAEIGQVAGTGSKGRITKEDVQNYIKAQLANINQASHTNQGAASTGMGIEPIPTIDFSQFGEISEQPLSRIKKISGPHLSRAWLNIPHVTHHDEFDITELENFRKVIKDEALKSDVRITLLAFIAQALTKALIKFPTFNSSLSPDGSALILKKYINIGIAVDTPNGLMVPNIKDCNSKSAYDLARDMMDISIAARDGKIKPDMLKGGSFSISSLGGIGGTAFTPIVNAPEVAILGITRSQMKPIWNGKEFVPKLMLPLDLSYDHRAIDGAEAARFMAYLGQLLSDPKRLLL